MDPKKIGNERSTRDVPLGFTAAAAAARRAFRPLHPADAPGAMSAPALEHPPPVARLDGAPRRLPKGASDPISQRGGGCECDRSKGAIVLFYAYVPIADPASLVTELRATCGSNGVTGKLRIGREGINGTAAGSHVGIDAMIHALASCAREPRLAAAAKSLDYKHAPGCACLFDDLSVRLVPEIVPFEPSTGGAKSARKKRRGGRHATVGGDDDGDERGTETDASAPSAPSAPVPCPVGYLDPRDFHDAVRDRAASASTSDVVILDVRNWYESRVGHFEGAVLAPIRRFSQLPEYVESNKTLFHGKDVLMYCTGGIRCEKAARYLASLGENDGGGEKKNGDDAGVTGRPRSVRQLRGGIVAYARDVLGAEAGAEAGAETKSAYKGLNFVFDNRGAVPVTSDVVTWCDGCGARSNRLGKCAGFGCHVILVVCEACGGGNGDANGEARVFCCGSCEAQTIARETTPGAKQKRKPCECDGYESRRRRLLPTPTPGSVG